VKEVGLQIEPGEPAWLKDSPVKFLPLPKFVAAECGRDGTMDRLGVSGYNFYVDPPARYRNPNSDPETGVPVFASHGIPLWQHWGVAGDYPIQYAAIYGCRVYWVVTPQPQGLLTPRGKPQLPIATAITGARDGAAGQMNAKLGANRMESVQDLAKIISHLSDPRVNVPFVCSGHSLGGITTMNAFSLVQQERKDNAGSSDPFIANALRVDLWAPANMFYPDVLDGRVNVMRHGDDWVNRVSEIGLRLKRVLAGAYEEGQGRATVNGNGPILLPEGGPLGLLRNSVEILAPGESHEMSAYARNAHLFLINVAYAKAKIEHRHGRESWSDERGATRAAKELYVLMKQGTLAPPVFLRAIEFMAVSYHHPAFRVEAQAFGRELLRLAPKGHIGKYEIPAEYFLAIRHLAKEPE
jgi:hypothetical protein